MKNIFQLMLTLVALSFCVNYGIAQQQSAKNKKEEKTLNDVRIGQCFDRDKIEDWIKGETTQGLVMDSRPFAINQSTGKLLFTSGTGRVSVVHMNPLVYDYRISVAQQELVSTALSDFIKLLLPQSLTSAIGIQSGDASARAAKVAADKLTPLETRLNSFNRATCTVDPAACDATQAMLEVFNEIQKGLKPSDPKIESPREQLDTSPIEGNFVNYSVKLRDARNEQLETFESCQKAQQLNTELIGYQIDADFKDLDDAQKKISQLTSLVADLQQLTEDYNKDTGLKDKIVRCKGFNCTNQFAEYAKVVRNILGIYQTKLDNLRQKNQEMQNMKTLTNQMKEKAGLYARTFTIIKKFELSQATIAVKRERLEPRQSATSGTQSGTATSDTNNNTAPAPNTEGTLGNQFGPSFVPGGVQSGMAAAPAPSATPNPGSSPPKNATPLVGEINEVVQLGRPRFMLSAGMVYSPLPRRTFKAIKGFVLDAQGNPTGNGDANVVGFEQNSPRRLFPMVFLNSRLLDYEQGSLYFSVGVTAKHDNNVDIEYLLGPSVSFLNDRALFTFGAYGGLTQNLVNDVKIGDAIPDSLGDAELFRKGLTWKPGFSFSYSLSRTKKREAPASSGGSASPADDLRNEIRIGSIPFNLALGLAYTSLEQRTYDEIAGFARDRQGALTKGQTLARIVGVTSSSNYRLSPLAMLHSRLTNFGSYDFYFTSGITGKKTDNDFDVEYLLGGSVNVYRRKVFLTFGTYVGKQELLGGNFFEGLGLAKTQNVTKEKRYVWKPAIAFSYDISRIIPR